MRFLSRKALCGASRRALLVEFGPELLLMWRILGSVLLCGLKSLFDPIVGSHLAFRIFRDLHLTAELEPSSR